MKSSTGSKPRTFSPRAVAEAEREFEVSAQMDKQVLVQEDGYGASVIVPHYNDVDRLHVCLSALVPQLASTSVSTEIIVVDNNSTDDLTTIANEFPEVRLVVETKQGAAEARNRGVRESNAKRIYFLDCDCIPAKDWLNVAHRAIADADIVGGRVDTFDETPPPRSGAEAFETVFAFQQKAYIEEKQFSVTANLLTWRSVFDATGPFRAGVSEDVDWCHRAVGAGYKLTYNADLAVMHPTRQDWPALERKWRRMCREAFELSGRGPLKRLLWTARSVAVLGSVAIHLPKLFLSRRLETFGERLRGVATLIKLRSVRCYWMVRQAAGLPI